jgi:hypothetical protein
MKVSLFYPIVIAAIHFCAANAQIVKLGEPLGTKETIKVSDILNNPRDFVGKRVQVKGIVNDVCIEDGCWINLKDEASGQMIKVKVDAKEFTFPLEVKDMLAVVEGKVHAVELNVEKAKDEQEESDSAKMKDIGTVYEIYASGAIIRPQLKNIPKID